MGAVGWVDHFLEWERKEIRVDHPSVEGSRPARLAMVGCGLAMAVIGRNCATLLVCSRMPDLC